MTSYVEDYKKKYIDERLAAKRWGPLLGTIVLTKNETIVRKIAHFCEYYEGLIQLLKNQQIISPNFSSHNPLKYYGLFPFEDCIKILSDEANKQLIFGAKRIEYEYQNIFTGKKGLMLEGNIMFEDGKCVNMDIEDLIEEKVIKILNNKIRWILSPSLRTREKKLRRILNER